MKKENELKLGTKMICAGTAACTAEIVSFPLDVAKVRLQISSSSVVGKIGSKSSMYNGLLGTVFGMVKREGFKSLYGGISPGLQRQCVFASIRIGFYEPVKEFYTKQFNLDESGTSTMIIRITSAITTGTIGISVAQPTDVVKVRMQAQPKVGALKYTSSIHAYKTIFETEGIRGMWKGLGPNIVRNSIVNAAELVCYDTVKDHLISKNLLKDGLICHFISAFSAGFCATFVSSPIDVVKTNYMNSTSQYKSVFHCARSIAHDGGLFAFYKGFMPSFMRLGTWNVCMFMTFEQLKRLSQSFKDDSTIDQQILSTLSKPNTVL